MSHTRPFSLLIKPASADCNLRCEYCFYLDRLNLYPETKHHRMSDQTLERMIESYMETNQPQYSFGWQGGEPTLMGVDFFRKATGLQEKHAKKGSVIANALQTNATLLDNEFAEHLKEYNFLVGVSLDGPAEIHNHYRRKINGEGSHSAVLQGIEALTRYQVEFNILTLVSSVNAKKGKEVFNYLYDLGFYYQQYIPCVEFDDYGKPLSYAIDGKGWGDFLCAVFDEWMGKDPTRVSIRLFDSILALLIDGVYNLCHMTGSCRQYFVVEYNGDIYPCDFFVQPDLKLANINDTSWRLLQNSEEYHTFGDQKAKWNNQCQTCEYLVYCSGDCLKHRLYQGAEPETLSWLCEGWKRFFAYSLPELKKLAASIIERRRNSPHSKYLNNQ